VDAIISVDDFLFASNISAIECYCDPFVHGGFSKDKRGGLLVTKLFTTGQDKMNYLVKSDLLQRKKYEAHISNILLGYWMKKLTLSKQSGVKHALLAARILQTVHR
jgi:hypothetical protein